MRLKRFTSIQKAFHILLMLSFLTQAVTGTARMYIETHWGRMLAAPFNGYNGCLVVHKYVGLFMLFLFLCHLIYALFVVFAHKVDRDDSLWPQGKDIRQAFAHLRWMFGGEHPRFDRWGYWEKFDYWAVFWGMLILGGTGLMLYSPIETSRYFKGWGLNVALWVHRIEACLAMLHIFIIHFAVAHLRRHTFPMDRAMFSGDADLETSSQERPAWITRLRTNNELENKIASDAPTIKIAMSYVIGLSAVILGIYLVVGGLMNAWLVHW
ncbi:formate dehydrogenase subunit gamma [Pseudodesulfovibrio sediminis]|uniref:Cytochrome b561 bacterial/Ni-hydrogenase domain-containing protein n=1 Tax=Pseudodesulfovibrio sediminis TaxID=2810563 RepID=A0ABN6EVN1_9BACT|nr:cytochrome b/b6 domain-containing protein [Pseudodesulfovibrio sediminis]BCS89249.1 hypothetical protein PSDVSF_24910 [Pseudodesulfovibrio sediminis]